MDKIVAFIIIATSSFLLTGLLRRYALSRDLLDTPNERSSHTMPTPRGGGVAIVITFLVGVVLLWGLSDLGIRPFTAIFGAGLLIATIGFMDDHGHIAARWRLTAHFSAAGWLLFWLNGLPSLIIFGVEIDLGWAGNIAALIALVWLLNLYNFMDGIDGIAGVEALSTVFVAGIVMFMIFEDQLVVNLYVIMFASIVGFLLWNFPPAKIFMGDAGSGFLGLMLGALALYSLHIEHEMLWVWLILLGNFIVDATYTLIHRLLRGEKVYEAHRSHAYQYASRKYRSHLKVTLAVLFINLFWLAPCSVAVALGLVDGALGLMMAYAPLLCLAWYFHAGEIERLS